LRSALGPPGVDTGSDEPCNCPYEQQTARERISGEEGEEKGDKEI